MRKSKFNVEVFDTLEDRVIYSSVVNDASLDSVINNLSISYPSHRYQIDVDEYTKEIVTEENDDEE